MCRYPLAAVLTATLGWLAATAAATDLVIVDKGKATAVIVVEKEQTKAKQAAETLRSVLTKMSGATLGIVTDGEPVPRGLVELHVGHTAAAKKAVKDIPAGFDPRPRPEVFEEEGFVLKTAGRKVIIAGNNDGPYKGTIFAVHRLLERLGCRWYFPSAWGEIIPKRQTVALPKLDVRSRPDFAARHVNAGGWIKVSKEERAAYRVWAERLGMTSGTLYPLVGDGFLASLVHPKEYFKTHPEWFAMDKSGKRKAYWHQAGW